MIPLGYLAKKISPKPELLNNARIADIYSVSACISENFADYIHYWKHNGYWLFDSPQIIINLVAEQRIELADTLMFYYQAYELEYDVNHSNWQAFRPEPSFTTKIIEPTEKTLQGYDIVAFAGGTAPECSPLSCNYLAETIPVNSHCLLDSAENAKRLLERGAFARCEPGPYRIIAVYTLPGQQDDPTLRRPR